MRATMAGVTVTSDSNDSALGEDLLTVGVYTLPDAARLARVPLASIRRWTQGYSFTRNGQRHWSPPLVPPQLDKIQGVPALSFLDLQELRLLHMFRERGASWQTLRVAHERARQAVGHLHPFSTGRFRSAGQEILRDVVASQSDHALENIVSGQLVFRKFIAPYLRGLEYDDKVVVRWFPRRDRRVVIDPKQSFGQPVVREGVPTRTLAQSFKTERSVERVARWYHVDPSSVRAAVDFERRLAA
jgi:uncharacterized protein (DUF433 family)